MIVRSAQIHIPFTTDALWTESPAPGASASSVTYWWGNAGSPGPPVIPAVRLFGPAKNWVFGQNLFLSTILSLGGPGPLGNLSRTVSWTETVSFVDPSGTVLTRPDTTLAQFTRSGTVYRSDPAPSVSGTYSSSTSLTSTPTPAQASFQGAWAGLNLALSWGPANDAYWNFGPGGILDIVVGRWPG